MNKPRIVLFYVLITGLSLALSSLPDRPRYVNDGHDLNVYQIRGAWLPENKQPYKDVFSEYPQLATYMFAIPYAITDSAANPDIYRYIFSLLMELCLATMIVLIYQYRRDTKKLAFLLLLPACLYFSHNRFDIVPSLFVVISLLMLFNRHFYSAFIFLAISVLFKWYALVLLPVYFNYCLSQDKRNIWKLLTAFFIPILIIVLHSIITIGWDNFLVPYKHHLGRGLNQESLLYLLSLINPFEETAVFTLVFLLLFLGLQFAVSFMALFAKIETEDQVIFWSIASVTCFMLFAKYYSPQWILWLTPLFLLIAGGKRIIIMIILFDLITYVYFPVIFGFRKSTQWDRVLIFHLFIIIKTGFLMYFLYYSLNMVYSSINIPLFLKRHFRHT